MMLGDETIFFLIEQPLRGMELQEKEKDGNHRGNGKNFVY